MQQQFKNCVYWLVLLFIINIYFLNRCTLLEMKQRRFPCLPLFTSLQLQLKNGTVSIFNSPKKLLQSWNIKNGNCNAGSFNLNVYSKVSLQFNLFLQLSFNCMRLWCSVFFVQGRWSVRVHFHNEWSDFPPVSVTKLAQCGVRIFAHTGWEEGEGIISIVHVKSQQQLGFLRLFFVLKPLPTSPVQSKQHCKEPNALWDTFKGPLAL